MWPFRKHIDTLLEAGLMSGLTDWHSHILPGVDDGIRTMEESIEILRRYDELGVKRVWLTPHIMEDYPNTPEELQRRFEELCLEWNGNVELRLASENMLDSLFEERLENRDFLPIGDEKRHLLVETSYFNPPMNMQDLLDGIFSAGYYPVLAHPERYRYMKEEDYRRLKDRGIFFQCNLMSLVGAYGETARKKAEWLLKEGMVDLTGSDVHRLKMLCQYIETAPRKWDHLDRLLQVASHPHLD